jgi:type II secretory pathway pseudopilin PulG
MATNRLLRLRRASRDDSGTSLIEMAVSLLVFGILSIMVMTVVMSTMNDANGATHRFDNLGDAQPVMDVISRDIRAASDVVSASATSVTLDASLGAPGGATRVTFTLANTGTLTETDVASAGQGATSTRVLSTHIAWPGPSGTALFSYENINGAALTAGQAGASPSSVAAISVSFSDNESITSSSAVTLQTTVWIRDAEYAAE